MALVWAEPFDQYGSTLSMANMALMAQSFGYSTVVQGNSWVTGAAARTGVSLRMAGSNGLLKRTLNNSATTLIQGVGLFFNAANSGHNATLNSGLAAESAGATEFLITQNASNGFNVYDRTNTLVGSTPPNVAPQGVWMYLEAKATINTGGGINPNTGVVVLRVNGVTQLTVNGINLPNQFTIARLGGNGLWDATVDDWYVCDQTGAINNDFLGDRRLVWSVPNAGTAQADFTANPAGTPFDRINDSPPTGAPTDTAWIEGAAAGNISDFARTSVNIAGNDIAGVVLVGRLAKSDAGACTGTIGINSNGNVLNSVPLNPGTSFGYFQSIVELDPNGNIPWTRAAVDAALSRITRTA